MGRGGSVPRDNADMRGGSLSPNSGSAAHHGLSLAACGVAGVALAAWLPAVALISRPARMVLDVRASVVREDTVGLTFDDGPHPQGTPEILRLLAHAGARATFFLVGEQTERYPQLVREMLAAGHEIAIHCDRHRNPMRLTPRQQREDLEHARAKIVAASGVEPRRYRPPYGILTTPAILEARRRGWEVVLWRSHGRDWSARATADSIADRVLDKVGGAEVLLLHDADHYSTPGSWRHTTGALPTVLERLARRGLTAESLATAGGTAA